MYRLLLLIAAALALTLTTGCSKEESPQQPVAKEQQATQQPAEAAKEAPMVPAETAKEAPMVTTEHAKEAAHQGFDITHEAMKEVHEGITQVHEGMKEAHQTTVETLATGKATVETLATGQAVYVKNCAVCHSTGVAGAPKLGDKAAWSVHIGEGIDHLMQVAINGEGAMPARGGNPALSDDELRAAVLYMLEESR